jgi:predicted DNA-binding protein with PD1-like motif
MELKNGSCIELIGQVGKVVFSRLLENEDLAESIKNVAKKSGIRAGIFMLIGNLKHVILGYYKEGRYQNMQLDGPLEIVSCTGNIAVDEKGETIVHAHIVVSNEKGEALGGHLMSDSIVDATAELVIIEASGIALQRVFDEKTKLRLLKLD